MATQTLPRTPGPATRTRPANPGTRPVTAPRHTRPVTRPEPRPAGPGPKGPRAARTGARPRTRAPRMPFIVLLVGLLGGALVSLLVISTTLAAGSFRIAHLKQQNTNLTRQEQMLADQVAQLSNPAQIAREARQLGMRQNPRLRFIDVKNGKIVSGKVSKADAAINVPGFTP